MPLNPFVKKKDMKNKALSESSADEEVEIELHGGPDDSHETQVTASTTKKKAGWPFKNRIKARTKQPGLDEEDKDDGEGTSSPMSSPEKAPLSASSPPPSPGKHSFSEDAIRRAALLHQRALVVGLLKNRVIWHPGSCCGHLRDLFFFTTQVRHFCNDPSIILYRYHHILHLLICSLSPSLCSTTRCYAYSLRTRPTRLDPGADFCTSVPQSSLRSFVRPSRRLSMALKKKCILMRK